MKVGLAHSMHIQRGSPLSPRFPAGRPRATTCAIALAVESSRSRLPVPQPARGSAPIRAGPEPPRGREGSGGRARMVSLSPPRRRQAAALRGDDSSMNLAAILATPLSLFSQGRSLFLSCTRSAV